MYSFTFTGVQARVLVVCLLTVSAAAQTSPSTILPEDRTLVQPATILPTGARRAGILPTTRYGFTTLVRDHALLWSSPVRSPRQALKLGLPLAAATAVSLQFDRRLASSLPNSADQIRYSKAVSEAGAYYSVGAAAGAFVALGTVAGSPRAVETGLLAAASIAHTESIAQMLKFAFGRERPDFGDATRGRFWYGQQSFPSGHAMATWAVATVISKEYHENRFIRYGIYAFPIIISASRVGARRHFMSDVVAGGTLGHLIGGWMYNTHHNPELGGAPIKARGVSIAPEFGVHPRWGGLSLRLNIVR